MIPDPASRPVVSAEEAFAELGIDRTTGYRAIRDGTFPLEVIRVGRLIRVPTTALRELLGFNSGGDSRSEQLPSMADGRPDSTEEHARE